MASFSRLSGTNSTSCSAFLVSNAIPKLSARACTAECASDDTQYYDLLADRTSLLLQLQGFAACGDPAVQEVVRGQFARMWQVVADATELAPVTVKSFLAFGMLLNVGAALDLTASDEPWATGIRTRIQPGLFEHITTATNQ